MYVNNFRCLVNFRAEFDSFTVLCGPNGTGQSSVFDALGLLRNLGTGDGLLGGTGDADVPSLEFTDWLDSTTQEFEVGLKIDGQVFVYSLHIEQAADYEKPRVVHEKATCNDSLLFVRDLDSSTLRAEVRLPKSDGNETGFPLDWRQTALSAIQPRGRSLDKISRLKEGIAKLLILRPNPRSMERESRSEARHPDLSLANLTSWYRSLSQEQDWSDALRDALQDVWPDFRSFKLVDAGLNTKALQLRFEHDKGKPTSLFFGQLSDGERALVGLYMVRTALQTGAARTVLLDEPDNFVGMPELQPWVLSMRELLDAQAQLMLISHHPEILDNSDQKNGLYLWRDHHTAPTRVGPLRVPDGMTAGEAVARGWVSGE